MIEELTVHRAIQEYIRDNEKKPDGIVAGYEAALDMMMFAGSVSYENGSSLMTPFGLLKIEFSPTCDTSEWSIR